MRASQSAIADDSAVAANGQPEQSAQQAVIDLGADGGQALDLAASICGQVHFVGRFNFWCSRHTTVHVHVTSGLQMPEPICVTLEPDSRVYLAPRQQ